jgi:hypothetical protein
LLVNAYREVVEESGIPLEDFALRHSGFIYQSREKDYPANHFFQYHIFVGEVDSDGIVHYNNQIRLKGVNYAIQRFHYYKAHPEIFNALRKDYKEKDAIVWFDPVETKLFGRWSPDIVMLYLNNMIGAPRLSLQAAVANKNRLLHEIENGL